MDPRERAAIAIAIALILFIYSASPWRINARWNRYFSLLADSSYSLFLHIFG